MTPGTAWAAAHQLTLRPDPRALTPLLEALTRPSMPHTAVADALVALGGGAAPALVAALTRDSVPQRAVDVLARIGPAAKPSITAGATSPNAQIRRYCTLLVDDEELVRAALTDPDCGVRWAASSNLVGRGVRFTAAEVVASGQAAHVAYHAGDLDLQRVATARVFGRPSPEIRAAAATATGSALARAHAGALAAIVEDETDDAGVRAQCLWQLKSADLPAPVLGGLCEQAYESRHRRLRHTAVNVMPPGAELDNILRRALHDPDWNVTDAARSRLSREFPPTPH